MQWTPRHYPLLKQIAREGKCDGEWEAWTLREMERDGAVGRPGQQWEMLDSGWNALRTYTRMLEEDPVLHELAALHQYAWGVRKADRALPDRPDILSSGRAYLGGALTTLRHLGQGASGLVPMD